MRGSAYDGLVDELLLALKARYGPQVLIHWEDFGAGNAFRLLAKYQEQVGCADGLRPPRCVEPCHTLFWSMREEALQAGTKKPIREHTSFTSPLTTMS